MALQSEITLNNGIQLSEAYIVINEILFSYPVNDIPSARISVLVYKDLQSKNSGKTEVTQFYYTVSGSTFETYFSENVLEQEGKTHLEQAYTYLKSLEMYENAIDV